MLNKKTIGLLITAILLGGGVLLFESHQANQGNSPTVDDITASNDVSGNDETLIPSAEGDITAFTIERPVVVEEDAETETLEAEEADAAADTSESNSDEIGTEADEPSEANAEDAVESQVDETAEIEEEAPVEIETLSFAKSEDQWQMTSPESGNASNAAVAFLLSQVTGEGARSLSISQQNLSEFGLDNPDTTLTLSDADGDYQLLIGSADFTGSQRYVQVTSPDADSEEDSSPDIYVVSDTLVTALTRPTQDWLESSE